MKTYFSDKFIYDRATDTLTADASQLGLKPGEHPDAVIFDDAIDVGFAIRSHRTGKLAVYSLKNTDQRDGDVRAWEYEPVQRHESLMCSKGDIAPWNSYRHTKVTIFNT